MPVCPIEYHTATFLGRLLDVIDEEIVPKTNAALQARVIRPGRQNALWLSISFGAPLIT
jgi:hypothetical protein